MEGIKLNTESKYETSCHINPELYVLIQIFSTSQIKSSKI